MNLVIGLTSPKRGGKDMVSEILHEYLNAKSDYMVSVMRFADPLKDMVAKLFDWDRDKLDHDIKFKETPDPDWNDLTPRRALQLIGTEMFRNGPLKSLYGVNFWVHHMKQRIEYNFQWDNNVIIIPDARFLDEFLLVKSLGGQMVFMDPIPRIYPDTFGHSSEIDMWTYSDYDLEIDTGHEKQKTEDEALEFAKRIAGGCFDDTACDGGG